MQHSEEICQEMWPGERTQYIYSLKYAELWHKNVNQNTTFDPIKDGTLGLGAASQKNYRCVDLTMMHICEKLKKSIKKCGLQSTHKISIWKKSVKKCSC